MNLLPTDRIGRPACSCSTRSATGAAPGTVIELDGEAVPRGVRCTSSRRTRSTCARCWPWRRFAARCRASWWRIGLEPAMVEMQHRALARWPSAALAELVERARGDRLARLGHPVARRWRPRRARDESRPRGLPHRRGAPDRAPPERLLRVGVEVGDDADIEVENFRFCLEALLGAPPFAGAHASRSRHDPGPTCGSPTWRWTMAVRTIEVRERVMARNDELAAGVRAGSADAGIPAFNLVSSPGSGKTALLERTLDALGEELGIERRHAATCRPRTTPTAWPAHTDRLVQAVVTGGACHLDASQVDRTRSTRSTSPRPGCSSSRTSATWSARRAGTWARTPRSCSSR